jgi:hypothetical protein
MNSFCASYWMGQMGDQYHIKGSEDHKILRTQWILSLMKIQTKSQIIHTICNRI